MYFFCVPWCHIYNCATQQILHTHLMPAHFYLHFASYFNSKYRKILHEYYTIKVTTKMTRMWSELTWCDRIWNLFVFKKHLPMWINVKFNFEFYHKFDYNFFFVFIPNLDPLLLELSNFPRQMRHCVPILCTSFLLLYLLLLYKFNTLVYINLTQKYFYVYTLKEHL